MTALKREFNRINKKYFGGQLPDVGVKWKRYRNADRGCMGICWPEDIEINAAHKSWKKVWGITLIHEMAHLATVEEKAQHGPKWEKEMKRLFKMGAFQGLL
jgi:hypothetical protein